MKLHQDNELFRPSWALLLSLAALTLGSSALPLAADELTGADRLLCSTIQVWECDRLEDGGCQQRPAEAVSAPLFFEIEVGEKRLDTTAASQEGRSTTISQVTREQGLLTLQGRELDRAFSFVIDEQSGLGALSVTASDEVVVIHTACTPDE